MNKQKLLVMFITFIFLIFITPIVFSKLMNSKLDSMIVTLNQHGYQIKELKNENSYITSKRYFDIKIPGKLINESVKWIEFRGFITFKNLPVTSVLMRGKLVDGKAQKYIQKLIDSLKGKLVLNVTTPNFKVFKFKADDINEKDLVLKNFQGIYDRGKLSYSFKEFKLKDTQILNANVKNSKTKSSMQFSFKNENFEMDGVKIDSLVTKKFDFNLSCKKVVLNSKKMKGVNLSVNVDTKKEALKLLQDGKFKKLQKYPIKILAKLNVADVLGLGDFHIGFFLDAKNLENIEDKIKAQKFDFINYFELKLKVKDKLMSFLANDPKVKLIATLAKYKDGYAWFEVKIQNNKVSINNE